MSVVVVGGGVTGLAAAARLARSGAATTVVAQGIGEVDAFEALAADDHDPTDPADPGLIAILRELGLGGSLLATGAACQLITSGRRRTLRCATSRALAGSLFDRLRSAITASRLFNKDVASSIDLDACTALAWLRSECVEARVQGLWAPVLRARFGRPWSRTSALIARAEIERFSALKRRPHGAIRGGLAAVMAALRSYAVRHGATIESIGPTDSLTIDAGGVTVRAGGRAFEAKRVVLAMAITEAQALLAASGIPSCLDGLHETEIEATTAWFEVEAPLTRHYWTALDDPRIPFQALIELTAVRPPDDFGGRHILAAVDRCGDGARPSAEEFAAACAQGLSLLRGPGGAPRILRSRVTRCFEPAFPVRAFDSRPPFEVVADRVYLATDLQAYPCVPSLESRLRISERVVEYVSARERIDARSRSPENQTAT